MNNKFDELATGMAQSGTRRQALKQLAVGLAGVALVIGASAQTVYPAGGSVRRMLGLSGSPLALSGAAGEVFYQVLHAYVPADIYAAYGVDALHAEGWTGKGQTIVIVDSYGSPTALADLQTFSAAFGLPVPDLTIIYPDGQPTLNLGGNGNGQIGWAAETSLDLQWAHAIAPDAKLVLIAANPENSPGVEGDPSIMKAIQYATTNFPGSPISQSFAGAEQTYAGSAAVQLAKYEEIYQQAAAVGCTLLASTGDSGTANVVKSKPSDVYPYPTVCWPASSPSVTAVGGTWLQYHWQWDPQTNFSAFLALQTVDPQAAYDTNPVAIAFLNWDTTDNRAEAVWREDWRVVRNGSGIATGGGLSAIFATPTWQANLPPSLTQGARALPDVSWNAAADGGVVVYWTPGGGWDWFYGTSAGSPQIAGLVAIVNQMRASMGKAPIGHLAPKLYQLPASDFNDIVPQTFGTDADAVTLQDNLRYGFDVPAWPTTVGYDLTTGLGSPRAYSFAHDLATMFP
jgi:subtilase family serine protease